MAAILYLNDTRVYPDESVSIKLVKENPYFTQSDSYTFDITLPMDILANRRLFKNIHRLEKTKEPQRLTCRLTVDNKLLLSGSARITQVTEKDAKVQLLGGNSEINYLSADESNYIDNLELGKIIMEETETNGGNTFGNNHRRKTDTGVVDTGIRCKDSYIFDETGQMIKSCHQYALVDICKQIFRSFGFSISECSIDQQPWTDLYVASAKATRTVAHTLPHWSLKTFIDEFCKFFNVTVIINQEHKDVHIKDNPTFFSNQEIIKINVADDYTAEMNEESEAHALAADNLSYDMSNSEHHDYDMISESVRENAYLEEYVSKGSALSAYTMASDDEKKGKIFSCPEGKFTGWIHDYSDVGGEEEHLLFTQIDVFAPLIRNKESGSETAMKICPVAMGEIVHEKTYQFGGGESKTNIWKGHIPSMANPTGDEYTPGRWGGSRSSSSFNDDEPTIQEYVMGDASFEKEEKEDRLQVMFIDNIPQPCFFYQGTADQWTESSIISGFTDFQFKKNHKGSTHNSWSLSLNKSEATYYIGQLHNNGFSFNMGARLCVKFLSKGMPDPTKIFVINNKRYGCEKIEAQIDSQGLSELVTGYFYEMNSQR